MSSPATASRRISTYSYPQYPDVRFDRHGPESPYHLCERDAGPRWRRPHEGRPMMLDALKLLDGDRLDASSPYAQAHPEQAPGKGSWAGAKPAPRSSPDPRASRSSSPVTSALSPIWSRSFSAHWSTTAASCSPITGCQITSTNIASSAENSVEELAEFKHIEAPEGRQPHCSSGAVRPSEASGGSSAGAAKGDESAVRSLQEALTALTQDTLTLRTDSGVRRSPSGVRLFFAMTSSDAARAQIDAVKSFGEQLSPYNTPGKAQESPADRRGY